MKLVLFLSSVLACTCSVFAAAPSASRPNIVYILADDMGYGDVHVLNPEQGKIPTPHLDRLAGEGMTFTDAHSGSSVCTPTRYGLLTGRYAWRTRLQSGVLDGGNEEPLIAAGQLTVATFLKSQGYTTACLGKWHLGFKSDQEVPAPPPGSVFAAWSPGARILGGPTERGFDYFWGCSNARTMAALIENDRVVESLPHDQMLPRLAARSVAYVREQATAAKEGRPFFLYVALTSPHTPILPTAEWKGKSGLGAYGDFVMQTDDVVGRILAAIADAGLAENTLVIFAADNGCATQANVEQLQAKGHHASGPYRGYKTSIWEGGHRIPFFARWPGRIAAGSRTEALVQLGDLMATLADVVGADLPPDAGPDSVSFWPVLQEKSRVARESAVHHSQHGRFAVREGDWKLVLAAGSGGNAGISEEDAKREGRPSAQFYNLRLDPAETTNLIEREPARAAKLRSLLDEMVARGRSTPGPALANDVEINVTAAKPVAAPTKERTK